MESIGHRLRGLAAAHGSRIALHAARGESVSYGALAADARRVADALARLGVAKGTRVGLLMPNRPDWLRCAFGAWRLGAVLVPINTLFRAPELGDALRHADVAVLITVGRFLRHDYLAMLLEICPTLAEAGPLRAAALPGLRHVVCDGNDLPRGALAWEDFLASGDARTTAWSAAALDAVDGSDDAAIFFTSGSTAAPKGVVHTHASMLHGANNVAERLGLETDDITYGYLPLFFNGGLVGVALAPLSRGGSIVLQEVFDADATLHLLTTYRCTTLFAWPHQADALLRHPAFDRDRLHLRKGPGANTRWAAALFRPDHQAVGAWGMSETGPMAACSRFDDALADRAGAHGRPMPDLDLRIVDPNSGLPLPPEREGEIVVRGPSLMRTYYKSDPRSCFDADGYFHTGDCGRLDARGWLHFVGRLTDVIKTAGVNVAAAEVEATLAQHPNVLVAHVVPVPHPTRGENVAAFVVRRDATCGSDALLAHCRATLASYKVPRHVFFVSAADLPTLGSGKVDRQRLRAAAAALAAADPGDD